MLMGDLISLKQLNLPVKVVVFNNGALGFIELEQKSTGFLDYGTELKNPNFAAMAESIGTRGIRLQNAGEVDEAMKAAIAHDGLVLIEAVVNRSESVSQSPLKDKSIFDFFDQNPPFELRPEKGFRLRQRPVPPMARHRSQGH